MEQDLPATLEGLILFRTIPVSFSGATASIVLEDCSRADASSEIIARTILSNISGRPDQNTPVPFRIMHPPLNRHRYYTVSAHIDLDGDGKISPGDYITVESYPVTPAKPMILYVQRVP